ncbi:protein of unknown function [Moritella yayanosii]|uniref:Uncharacterized protein n=1 Tax=Moritella yayanosii TaxID=69539 RepID=A0A330LLT9_9GAMM|nr:protein of unknown function [Moritella yayanosii]
MNCLNFSISLADIIQLLRSLLTMPLSSLFLVRISNDASSLITAASNNSLSKDNRLSNLFFLYVKVKPTNAKTAEDKAMNADIVEIIFPSLKKLCIENPRKS